MTPRTPSGSRPPDAEHGDFKVFDCEVVHRDEEGAVFRGWQQSRGREVGVRVIGEFLAPDPSSDEELRRREDRLTRVEDPHVVRWIVGSVAEKVIHSARGPVLVYKTEAHGIRGRTP